jgi:ABC-type multidrug transport system fused ATPase/permease subunit
VRRADRILVLENGMIVDEGNHERLMARTGTYRRLYEMQFEDMEATSRGE